MDVLVRLYVRHDSDLLDLYFNPKFSLASAMRDSLIAYVREKPVRFQVPFPYKQEKVKRNVSLHLYLHPDEDEDIIDFLLGMREGVRCAAIKNLVRGYMMYPNIYASMEDRETAMQKAERIYIKTDTEIEKTGQAFVRGRGNKGKRRMENEKIKNHSEKSEPMDKMRQESEKKMSSEMKKQGVDSMSEDEQRALEESMQDFMSEILA